MIKQVNNKKHILIVEDDQSITQMLSLLLSTRGYNVAVAQTGEEALNNASESTDLILLDLMLPDKEGFDVCRLLRQKKQTKNVPIIILSAKLLSEDIVEGLYLGADDYLTKPFEYEELVARMEAVMRRGAFFGNTTQNNRGQQMIIKELRRIVDEELIIPFFQPIYSVQSGKLFGLEALSRPKTHTMLSNPEFLFKAAIQYGFYHDLEIVAWKKALECASQFLTDEILFLNCNPYLVEGPKFLSVKSLFDESKIQAQNVILEITERSAISDFKVFYEHLCRFKEYGFQFAVDDVGGGFASLESIVETRPKVVKIDKHIIGDLANDQFKRSIVKFIVAFCKENKILSVAEGIETKEELEIVRELGVDAGQGYYLFKPTPVVDLAEMSTISA